MKIGILETGAPAAPLVERHGRYDVMFRRLLDGAGFDFETFNVYEAAPPAAGAADGWIVTGSAAGVYEGHDWIAPLEAFIRDASERAPMFGVCFGHQVMARAFGGVVEKSAKGWGVGVHSYYVLEAADWTDPGVLRVDCAVSHQDQVIRAPDGARRLAASNFTPNAVLEHGPRAASMQCHPEFEHAFALDLLEHRKESIPEDVASVARISLAAGADRLALGGWIARFLTSRAA